MLIRLWGWFLALALVGVNLPALHAAPARENSAKKSITRVALFTLNGTATGQALKPGSAAVSRARRAGRKPQGRTSPLAQASFAALRKVAKGTAVRLPLAKGEIVDGIVSRVQTDKGTLRVSGSLANGQAGSFVLSLRNGQAGGLIQLPAKGLAYRIDKAGTGVVLREVLRSEVICTPFPRPANQVSRSTPAPTGSSALAAPPILNSRPSAVSQIYLDFDGETVTDPLWNNGNTINAASFGLSAATINGIFLRVKEDFWPFDINVTTDVQKYNAAPVGRRMRCIITPTDTAAPGAGGVAFINSFSEAGTGAFTSDIPCWAFVGDAVYCSEAIAHELGHTLGLLHDGREIPGTGHEEYFMGHGTGAISWCPIMGASYYVSVSQWSRGQYQYANNQEDDLAIISNAANGFGYVADDAGNSTGTATALGLSGDDIVQSGIISGVSDEDFYSFSTTGAVTIRADGAEAPDLDISLQLLDDTGAIVAQSNPATALKASLTTPLAAGDYFVRIVGSNAGNTTTSGYSTYGSIGAYTLSGAINGASSGPPNDNFANAATLSGTGGTLSGTPTTNSAGATEETGEPDHADNTGGASVWYVWTAPADGYVKVDTNGSDFDTVLGVYTGSNVSALAEIVSDDDAGTGSDSAVGFTATIGQTYYIAVDGFDAATGLIVLNWLQQPALTVSDVIVTEGNSGTTNAVFTVTLSPASDQTVKVNYATANGTAIQPGDYTAQSGILTFAPGDLTKTVTVVVKGDSSIESDETFLLNLTSPDNAFITDAQGACTITNDDVIPTLTINDINITETNGGSTQAAFTLTLSPASSQTVTVVAQTASNAGSPAATVGSDYAALAATTITFTPGQTTKTVNVTILGDTLDEPDEKFALNLSSPVSATIGDATGVCTILDNDNPPTINVSAPNVTEGNAGTQTMTFAVSLSAASARIVTVQYKTNNATTNTATAGTDYVAIPLTILTFAPGDTTKTVSVTVNGDTLDEDNERIALALSAPANATLGTINDGIIVDDDATPTLVINDISVNETNGGSAQAAFTLTLSAASGRTITLTAQSATGGSPAATAGADYTNIPATTITFTPGQTTRPVNVTVLGDIIDENDEKFVVNLSSATNVTLADNSGTCTIVDNDAPPLVNASAPNLTEGNAGTQTMTFTLSLSAVSARNISVQYKTDNATTFPATAGMDYTAVTLTTVIFLAGETIKTVTVTVSGDLLDEENERIALSLTNPVNATLGTISDGIIVDDDATPSLSINDVSQTEGNSGTSQMVFTLTLSAASGRTVTVYAQSAAGGSPSATAGSDYVALPQTLVTFAPGQTTKTVSVAINGDTTVEQNEKFVVNLSGYVNASISDNSGQGTITNDDAAGIVAPAPLTAPSG